MAIDVAQLRIVIYPHPTLRSPARPIETIDEEVRAVAGRMFELTAEAEGIGLAAPQVGLPWRMFITMAHEKEPARVYVNPGITIEGDLESREEGCLSLPDIHVDIRRPTSTTITARDLDGNEFTMSHDALLGRVWQHEVDHLQGVLIIDKMNPMDRIATRKAIKELESAGR